ncbi:MAG: nitrous oxide reductase accessory protein NosL [Campylobacteraceae bacterium]|jgi:nitrous oxide reductase accessory protein NosL|nr:nitrous oxide reductase accessory protein NosL [Campylobacteraceae bacterium]
MKNLFKLLAVCLLFLGCESKIDMSAKEVKLDRDVCAYCKMVISSANYAAQIVLKDGRRYFFDDIGCAILWLNMQDAQDGAYIYVADFKSAEWIDAKRAYYLSGANSPMRFGFAAYKEFQKDSLNFLEVKKIILEKENETRHMAHHTH